MRERDLFGSFEVLVSFSFSFSFSFSLVLVEVLDFTAILTKASFGIVTDGCLASCGNARKRFIWLI